MLHVGIAQLLRFVVFFQVVFALRQAEAALKRGADDLRAVPEVLSRIETKERAHALAVQALGLRLQIRFILDCGNPRQFRLDGFCSCEPGAALAFSAASRIWRRFCWFLSPSRVNEPQLEYSGGMGLDFIHPPMAN